MSRMKDTAAYKFLNNVSNITWSSTIDYIHNDFKWKIRNVSYRHNGHRDSGTDSDSDEEYNNVYRQYECFTYNNNKLIRESLKLNEKIDGTSNPNRLKYINCQTKTSIPKYIIVDSDVLLIPVGTSWAQIVIDTNCKAIATSIYNDILKISVQCTFVCDKILPIGLPIFNMSADRIVGFVGRKLADGRNTIESASNQQITKKIVSKQKYDIYFIDQIMKDDDDDDSNDINHKNTEGKKKKTTTTTSGYVTKSKKRVIVYGNISDENLSTNEIRKLEVRHLEKGEERRINIVQTNDGVVITITDGDDKYAFELECFCFLHTKLVKYYVLQPVKDFVVEEEKNIILSKNKKTKKPNKKQ